MSELKKDTLASFRRDHDLRFFVNSMARRFSDLPRSQVEETIEKARAELAPSLNRVRLTRLVIEILTEKQSLQ